MSNDLVVVKECTAHRNVLKLGDETLWTGIAELEIKVQGCWVYHLISVHAFAMDQKNARVKIKKYLDDSLPRMILDGKVGWSLCALKFIAEGEVAP